MRRDLPRLRLTPRARLEFKDCLHFIAQSPRGKAQDRRSDIVRGMHEILVAPKLRRVEIRRPRTGIELRRHYAAQFAIVYAYFERDLVHPAGVVSIRAIRHRRIRNVFTGVQQPALRNCRGLVLRDPAH